MWLIFFKWVETTTEFWSSLVSASVKPEHHRYMKSPIFLVNERGQTSESDSLLLGRLYEITYYQLHYVEQICIHICISKSSYLFIYIYIYLYLYTNYMFMTYDSQCLRVFVHHAILVRHFDSQKTSSISISENFQVMIVRFCLKLVAMFAMATWSIFLAAHGRSRVNMGGSPSRIIWELVG